MNPRRHNSNGRRSAFTLIELLVVIAIIVLLVALLAVAFSGALAAGKDAATQSLMNNIQTGMQQFKQDFGYLPPLIDGHKHAMDSIPDPAQRAMELEEHRYFSPYSLTVYLLGVGDLAPDPMDYGQGEAPDRHDGQAGPGFRDPGRDRSWGGARERDDHMAPTSGRVYGPYIDIGDGTDVLRRARVSDFPFLDSADAMEISEFFSWEYEATFGDATGPREAEGDLFVLVDRWDMPIRYYKDWPTRADIAGTVQTSPNRVPIELRSYDSVNQHLTSPLSGSRGGDPLLDPDILRAPYALLSAGADMDYGDTDRTDPMAIEQVDEDAFFTARGSTSIDEVKRIEPIKDNIRTTP